MRAPRAAALGLLLSAVFAGRALAQGEAPLVGPARDIARAIIVDAAVFDPLLVAPLSPDPQAVIDVHGRDISGTVHAALKNGDDSYGILLSAPLYPNDALRSAVDPRELRTHPSLGFDLTNVIWHPRAKPRLEQLLQPEGFARLSPDARASVARAIETTDSVAVPWVLFLHASYQFSRSEYRYLAPSTLTPQAETRLNDTASILGGVQFLVAPGDPGYFVGFSYIYSAVFRDADQVDGVSIGGPSKIRGNLLRLEMRRQLPRRKVGFNPSFTYDVSSHEKTADVAAYALFAPSKTNASRRLYGGVRAGYRTGTGGAFFTVFAGPVFGSVPQAGGPGARASRP